MIRLLHKSGKTKFFISVGDNLYVYKKEIDAYKNGNAVIVYTSDELCAISFGYFNCYNIIKLSKEDLQIKINEFKENILKTLIKENLDYGHEIYTSDFTYLNKLYGISKEVYDNFIEFYQNYLEQKRLEKEEKYSIETQKEQQEEIDRLNGIIENILNNSPISGRELLDIMLFKNISCPIKTKGMINRFYNITNETANVNGTMPIQNSINNVFKYYKITLDFLKEQKEYESMDDIDKKEIDDLFK